MTLRDRRRARAFGWRAHLVVILASCVALPGPAPPLRAQVTGSVARETLALSEARRLEQAGRAEEAQMVLQRFLDEQPMSSQALAVLLRMAEAGGDVGAALEYAEWAAGQSDDAGLRQTWIRALVAAGHADSALAVTRRWRAREPREPAAYSAEASVLAAGGRDADALEALRAGRQATGRPEAYTQEMAVLLARQGEVTAAAQEWALVLSWGDAGVDRVASWLGEAGLDQRRAVAALKEVLAGPGQSYIAVRGGVRLLLRRGDGQGSQELVSAAIDRLPGDARVALLREYVLETRNLGLLGEAAWGAAGLAAAVQGREEALYWRAVAADLEYRAGKAGNLQATFAEIARSSAPGTETHRLALRRLFSLRAEEDPAGAAALLADYRRSYPEERAEAAAMGEELARRWVREGDMPRARAALAEAGAADAGPSVAAALALQRGRVALYEGRLTEAAGHLQAAAAGPADEPLDRSEAMALLSMVARADSGEVARLGRALLLLQSGSGPSALLEAAGGWRETRVAGAPALLSVAAAELDRSGHQLDAAALRQGLVEGFPSAPEAAAALLLLARHTAPTDPVAAAAWLERLIVSHPESALAPLARAALEELKPEGHRAAP